MFCLDCSPQISSPPRTPLGPLNTANSARGEKAGSMTPQEDRLMKKVSKRNHRGETPLHCSAIKVGHSVIVLYSNLTVMYLGKCGHGQETFENGSRPKYSRQRR